KPGGFRDPVLPCLVNHLICTASATGNLLLDLKSLGADPMHKDLFVESDFMQEFTTDLLNPKDPPNGPKSTKHSHDLRLKTDVVDLIGDAFFFALVPNPDGHTGINFHLDAGLYSGNDNYFIKSSQGPTEGGDPVDERWPFYYCTSGTANCKFPNQPGIIHWALGLPILQGGLARTLQGGVPVIPLVIPPACKTDPTGCKRYFNEDERGLIFRYLFVGHDFAAEGSPLPGGGFSTRKVSGHAH